MNRSRKGKIIRTGIALGLVLLHVAAAYVIGSVLKSIYYGEHSENYAEIAPQPLATTSPSRAPASIGKPIRPRASKSKSSAEAVSRESHDTTEITFSSGGEESGAFMENFFEYLETGNWPKPGEKAAKPTEDKKDLLYGIGSRPRLGISSAANSSSSTAASGTTSSTPTINVQPPFFVSNTGGGINDVTGAGYKVNATGGAALSSVHGITPSGYRVWFNQGGQASP